jgi:hypothetical protein
MIEMTIIKIQAIMKKKHHKKEFISTYLKIQLGNENV